MCASCCSLHLVHEAYLCRSCFRNAIYPTFLSSQQFCTSYGSMIRGESNCYHCYHTWHTHNGLTWRRILRWWRWWRITSKPKGVMPAVAQNWSRHILVWGCLLWIELDIWLKTDLGTKQHPTASERSHASSLLKTDIIINVIVDRTRWSPKS